MKNVMFGLIFLVFGLMILGCIGIQSNTAIKDQPNNVKEIMPELIDRNITYLSAAQNTKTVELTNNSHFNLEAKEVTNEINGTTIKMYAYNGQIPGPTLKVKQGSTIYVNFTNNLHENTTVHWHGIRLQNQFDGVPSSSQKPIKPGESFLYKVDFPDEGVYWYHPHIREDIQQDLGMYGLIQVEPTNLSYYNKVDLEETIILDDILLSETDVYPYYKNATNFALMGRYGNQMLVNGKTNYSLSVNKGQIVRFFVLNSANVRPFNFSINNTKLKIIGGDSGKFEREFLANSVIIAPSERDIIEVEFNNTGTYQILNKNSESSQILGTVNVVQGNTNASSSFSTIRENTEIVNEIDKYRQYFNKTPDYEYSLTINIPGAEGMMGSMMEHHNEGIEWEDSMFGANKRSTNEELKWIIKDTKTGKINMNATEQVEKNKIVKIKITNDLHSIHPMQHPIHIHGARFLVVKTNGITNNDLVWKDTVLIPVGGSVELLTYFPNEGEWMMHCHIAEHLESGMMTSFEVK